MSTARSSGVQPVRPLAGIKVVELCDHAGGQWVGRLLCILGATVTKIESPAPEAPKIRSQPPLLQQEPPISALFAFLNAGKKSASLKLGVPETNDLLGRLIGNADIFITDVPVADRAALGIDPQECVERFLSLLYLSVLPYGAFGPRAHLDAEEINVFHSGGEGYLLPNGLTYDMFPDRPPLKGYGHLGTFQGGIGAAVAVMAALYARPAVGGQVIDVSLQDVNVALSGMNLQRYGDGVIETRPIRGFKYGGVFECVDGYIQILVLEQHQWRALVDAMGNPDWAKEEAFNDQLVRGQRGREINEHLRRWIRPLTTDQVMAELKSRAVPSGKYNSPDDIINLEHEAFREFFSLVPVGDGKAKIPTLPFRLSEEVGWSVGPIPEVAGQDNDPILGQEAGLTPATLSQLKANGLLG